MTRFDAFFPAAAVMFWIAFAGLLYAARYFLPMWWAGFPKTEQRALYVRRMWRGVFVFWGAGLLMFPVAYLASWLLGGGR